jgi:hypothetical protein
VRDYCLSINKAWGKNMHRAAQRWKDSIIKVRKDAEAFPDAYLEVKYEDILSETQSVLQTICAFLDLQFDEKMAFLSKSTENIGDAKGRNVIVKSNMGKYLASMKPEMRRSIESLTTPVLKSIGYPVDYAGDLRRLSTLEMKYYKIKDGINLLRFSVKERGLVNALKMRIQFYKISI